MFGLFLASFTLFTLLTVLYVVFKRYNEKLYQPLSLIHYSTTANNGIVTDNAVVSLKSAEPSPSLDQGSTGRIQKERTDIGIPTKPLNAITTSITTENKWKNTWQCACEGGIFLPNSMLKSFNGVEAVFKMGSGQCYHKKNI
jgi:hypothetical protein